LLESPDGVSIGRPFYNDDLSATRKQMGDGGGIVFDRPAFDWASAPWMDRHNRTCGSIYPGLIQPRTPNLPVIIRRNQLGRRQPVGDTEFEQRVCEPVCRMPAPSCLREGRSNHHFGYS
jgi:hypothetical protein